MDVKVLFPSGTVSVLLCIPQVSDEYLAPDLLSTVKDMKVANFRRVPKMPVYGMSQPNTEVHLSMFTQGPKLPRKTYGAPEGTWVENILVSA